MTDRLIKINDTNKNTHVIFNPDFIQGVIDKKSNGGKGTSNTVLLPDYAFETYDTLEQIMEKIRDYRDHCLSRVLADNDVQQPITSDRSAAPLSDADDSSGPSPAVQDDDTHSEGSDAEAQLNDR